MILACPLPNAASPVLKSLSDYLDCHAQTLGENGFQSLAGGLMMPAVLTGCLTIYIALIGYRLMLGEGFGVRDAVFSALRVGLVITFCTGWPSYEIGIYRVITEGPNEIASAVLQPTTMTVSSISETAQRFQAAYDAIQTQATLGRPDGPSIKPTFSPSLLTPGAAPTVTPAGVASAQQTPISNAGLLFVMSTIGGLLALRLAAGILLAVGPLVIAVTLFDSMLGFLEGWVRALAGVALGGAGLMIVTALQLSFVEAEIAGTEAGAVGALNGQGLTVVAVIFTLVTLAVLTASGLVARGFRLPWRLPSADGQGLALRASTSGLPPPMPALTFRPEPVARARAVADAVILQGQRERSNEPLGNHDRFPSLKMAAIYSKPSGVDQNDRPQTLSYDLRRDPVSRRTASIARRNDRR